MARYSNVINFVLTPFVALIFYLAYWRHRYNYTEHLVASLYISGMNALFFILVITPYLLLARDTPYFYFGIYAFFAFEIIYRTVFLLSFHQPAEDRLYTASLIPDSPAGLRLDEALHLFLQTLCGYRICFLTGLFEWA